MAVLEPYDFELDVPQTPNMIAEKIVKWIISWKTKKHFADLVKDAFTFFSKTLDLSVAKNGSKQVNNTNFGFLMVKLTYVPLPWQHE